MATVLEEYTTEEQSSVVQFVCAIWLNIKNIHKEMFPVFGGKCLWRKAVHNSVEKLSQGHSKVADDARPGAKVNETTLKRLLCCGFRRTGKAIGQVYQCWWRICRGINAFFFQVRILTCFKFYIYLWPIYWLSLRKQTYAFSLLHSILALWHINPFRITWCFYTSESHVTNSCFPHPVTLIPAFPLHCLHDNW
jgi:hypothetical protein